MISAHFFFAHMMMMMIANVSAMISKPRQQ